MLLNYQQTKVKAGRIRKYQAILPNKREETIIAQKTKKSSSDNAKKIQWHPAFYAAAELELKENIEELDLISEYHLSKEPIRIDLLIIKEENADKVMKNEIGIAELSKISGVPERIILDIMAGVKEPELGAMCKIAEGLGICVHELRADEESYAVSVPKDTLAKLIVVSEINGVELEELINCILEKGIEEHGFYA